MSRSDELANRLLMLSGFHQALAFTAPNVPHADFAALLIEAASALRSQAAPRAEQRATTRSESTREKMRASWTPERREKMRKHMLRANARAASSLTTTAPE